MAFLLVFQKRCQRFPFFLLQTGTHERLCKVNGLREQDGQWASRFQQKSGRSAQSPSLQISCPIRPERMFVHQSQYSTIQRYTKYGGALCRHSGAFFLRAFHFHHWQKHSKPAGGRKRMVLSSRRLDLPRLLHACEVIGFIYFIQRTFLREGCGGFRASGQEPPAGMKWLFPSPKVDNVKPAGGRENPAILC